MFNDNRAKIRWRASRSYIGKLFINLRRINLGNIRRPFPKNKYFPYVVSLVAMKLTIMMMFASSTKRLSVPANSLSSSDVNHTTTVIETEELRNYWKTIDHLENGNDDIEILPTGTNRTSHSSIWLIYNRVPRSGGLTMVHLIKEMSEKNHFSHQRHGYRTPWNRLLTDDEMKNLVTWFEYQHHPKSYDRHFLHVNFTHYQKYTKNLHPTYVNLIRDPAEREYSIFRARRSQDPIQISREIRRRDGLRAGSGMEWYTKSFEDCVLDEEDPECDFRNSTSNAFSHSIPYFCGQDPRCLIPGNRWALQRAKLVVEYEYAVVGILERMLETITVLEEYVPKFFNGSKYSYFEDTYYGHRHENQDIKSKPELSREVMDKLKTDLALEYEFYEFCQQRLYKQHQKLSIL